MKRNARVDIDIGIDIDVSIRAGHWPSAASLRPLVERAIHAAATAVPLDDSAAPRDLSVVFTDDDEIRTLNARFRGRDGATNVLTFPAAAMAAQGRALGDIVLAQETISDEARAGGLTLDHHITHLLVHGFLHILGFDHGNDAEAMAMESLETAVLARLGVADPYAGA